MLREIWFSTIFVSIPSFIHKTTDKTTPQTTIILHKDSFLMTYSRCRIVVFPAGSKVCKSSRTALLYKSLSGFLGSLSNRRYSHCANLSPILSTSFYSCLQPVFVFLCTSMHMQYANSFVILRYEGFCLKSGMPRYRQRGQPSLKSTQTDYGTGSQNNPSWSARYRR